LDFGFSSVAIGVLLAPGIGDSAIAGRDDSAIENDGKQTKVEVFPEPLDDVANRLERYWIRDSDA
jgi:hypothetical protein